MRVFPSRETMKAFMRKGLPFIFAVAWTPVVWMLLATLLGPAMERLFGAWQVVLAALVVATLSVTFALTQLFRRYGLKIFGESGL
jgi:hypothetical protein